jgi:hypothetical protein
MKDKVSIQNGVLAEKSFHRLSKGLSGLRRRLIAIGLVRRCGSAFSVRSV